MKYKRVVKCLNYIILVVVVGMGIFNCYYFDIGRVLDPNLSATKLYREEFAKLPDNAIFMPNYAWEWESIFKYNKDYNKNIYPICIDILPSETYREQLIKDGIKLTESKVENISIKSSEIAKSIVTLNDNVWTTVSYDPYTFGSNVVETNHDANLVANVDREKIKQIKEHPQIQWKPYSPFDVLTTRIFITDWNYILYSNWSVRFFASWACAGLIIVWFFNWFSNRRSKADFENDGEVK